MNRMINALSKLSQKMGNQIHMKSIRDAFATILAGIMLAGFMILLNSTVLKSGGILSSIISDSTLSTIRELGQSIVNGTLSILTLSIGVAISYHLAKNRNFENPFSAVIVTLSVIFILIPAVNTVALADGSGTAIVSGVFPAALTGSGGMFVGIIVALASTELFIKLSNNKKLTIHISGDGVPPAVEKSFNVLIPSILTMFIIAFVALILTLIFKVDVYSIVGTIIQKPLSYLVGSVPGFLALMTLSGALYSVGISGAGILSPIMDPILLQNQQENMMAFANNTEIPNIITTTFRDVYGVMGGGGNTIALLAAIFLVSKIKSRRDIALMASVPSIFNINEPVVFGLPIVYDLTLMIPFILATPLSLLVAYFATALGVVGEVVVMVPWTTPVLLSGFLATGGDWRAIILQAVILVMCTLLYIPFLLASDRGLKMNELEGDY